MKKIFFTWVLFSTVVGQLFSQQRFIYEDINYECSVVIDSEFEEAMNRQGSEMKLNYNFEIDSQPIRVYIVYSLGDTLEYGYSQKEWEYYIERQVIEMGNLISWRSGTVDTEVTDAFKVDRIAGVPQSEFDQYESIRDIVNQTDPEFLTEQLEEYHCLGSHLFIIFADSRLSGPPGIANLITPWQFSFLLNQDYYTRLHRTVIRSFTVNNFIFASKRYEEADNLEDSLRFKQVMENSSGTLFHEIGHLMGCSHFFPQRSLSYGDPVLFENTTGPTPGTHGSSIMWGGNSFRTFNYSNIDGNEPLTNGIANNARTIRKMRHFYHQFFPAFSMESKISADTIVLRPEIEKPVDLAVILKDSAFFTSRYEFQWVLPNGEIVEEKNVDLLLSFDSDWLQEGENWFVSRGIRMCDGETSAEDSLLLVVIFEEPTAVAENDLSNKTNVFPNPASDYLFIDSKLNIVYFELYSTMGSLVKKGKVYPGSNQTALDLSSLHPGSYSLILKSESEQIIKSTKIVLK